MKRRTILLVAATLVTAGCTGLQDPSKRNQVALTDFFNPQANTAYYEFSSSPLDTPSVLTDEEEASSQEAALAEDEDFTAENASGTYATYGDVVVTVASHKFKLGPSAGRTEMTAFQKALDEGYKATLKQYRPVGFTYSMSSLGTVNPLSDIEVACKLSERSANQVGQETCKGFFKEISTRYLKLMKEARF